MNINYEDIITKANARKDALKAIEAEISEVHDMSESLKACLEYFVDLGKMTSALDAEGLQMLGAAHDPIYRVSENCKGMRHSLFGPSGTGYLAELQKAVRA